MGVQILLVILVDVFLVAADQDSLDLTHKEVSKVFELQKNVIRSNLEDAHEPRI